MKALFAGYAQKAIVAAAALTGKKFGLLVASSVVATSVIVASAMTATNGSGPLAALLGRSLAADQAPAVSEPAPAEETYEPPSSPGSQSSSPASAPPSVAPAPASESESEAGSESESKPEEEEKHEEPAPETGPANHVFVVSVASPGYDAAFGEASQMPYLAGTLRPKGLLLTNFKLLGAAAPANAIAAVAGQPPNASTKAGCPTYDEIPASTEANKRGVIAASGCVYPVTALTLADQLGSSSRTWRAYMESMADESDKPANCVHPEADATETPAAGAYSSKLNPFAYFHSLLDLGDCSTGDVPLTGLEKDLTKVATTPNYTYVSPTPCNAGFAGQCPAGTPEGPAAADAFLANWVPKILASPAYRKDGLLIITFSAVSPAAATGAEGTTGATGATGTTESTAASSLKTGTLLISNYVSPGSTDGAAYNPYSLLRASDELFGLAPLGEAAGPKVKTFVPAMRGADGGD